MHAEEIIPLEFIYDKPPPADDAKLCAGAEESLKKGICQNCAALETSSRPICPLGFWGISKVIERHLYNSDESNLLAKEGAVAKIAFEPHSKGRDLLRHGRSLFASSSNVFEEDRKSVIDTLQRYWADEVAVVEEWEQWGDTIKKQAPSLILMLPHNTGAKATIGLEISNDRQMTLHIAERFKKAYKKSTHGKLPIPPILCLIGCDTAGTAESYAKHVTAFRRADAPLVLTTIATVFGKHAARVSESLVCELMTNAEAAPPQRFGEVLRSVKRKALLDSLPMALCLAAFGDADWILVKEP